MLVLSRKTSERIVIGGGTSGYPEVTLIVVEIVGGRVKLGIEAPRDVRVMREELLPPNHDVRGAK